MENNAKTATNTTNILDNIVEYAGDTIMLTVKLAAATSLAFLTFKKVKEAYQLNQELEQKWNKKIDNMLK